MAKRYTFEEIIGQEFRWPQPGDDPFALPGGVEDQAVLNEDNFARFVVMMGGYKAAAENLVDIARSDDVKRDCLVFPILFLYRHCLELNLKYIINIYGGHVGIDPVWNTHDLGKLWETFAILLDRFGTTDPDDADHVVGGIVAQFAKIDPRSFSYRYPCDTRGEPIPFDNTQIHLATLRDVMDGVFGYFTGCDGYLSDLAGAGP